MTKFHNLTNGAAKIVCFCILFVLLCACTSPLQQWHNIEKKELGDCTKDDLLELENLEDKLGESQQRELLLQRIVKLRLALAPQENIMLARAYEELADYYRKKNLNSEAIENYSQSILLLESDKRLFKNGKPNVISHGSRFVKDTSEEDEIIDCGEDWYLSTCKAYAKVLERAGKDEEASEMYNKAIQFVEAKVDKDDPDLLKVLEPCADFLKRSADETAYLKLRERILRIKGLEFEKEEQEREKEERDSEGPDQYDGP